MPIDYRIPASGNQIQPFDLGAVMDTAAKIEIARAKRQQMIDAAADEAAIAAALKSASGPQGIDYESAINALAHRPNAMMHLQTQVDEHRKKSADALKVHLDNQDAEGRILAQWAPTIKDQFTLDVARRVLSPEMAQYLPQQWDEQAASLMQQLAEGGLKASDKASARKQILDEWQQTQNDRKALLGWLATADTPEEWAETLKGAAQLGISPRVVATMPPEFTPEGLERVKNELIGPAALADDSRQLDALAETARHNLNTETNQRAQEKRLSAQGSGGSKGLSDEDKKLVDAVMANPSIIQNLTPTKIGTISGELHARGFNGFGKSMTEGAIGKVAETKSAIQSLQDLRTTLKENEQYIGPLAGFQAANPYSAARQAQAKIDLVRQRVGKALEGGVLRKEDEEKYKKILATLRDTPETAIFKVDNLIATLNRDIETFIETQKQAGRNTGGIAAPGVTGAPKEGDEREVPGHPGVIAVFRGGKWIVK